MASFEKNKPSSPRAGIVRTPSSKLSASEKAAEWAKKKQAAVAKAAELQAERNTRKHIEEEFNKHLEAANENLVMSWTNDEFARITKSPSIKPKRTSLSSSPPNPTKTSESSSAEKLSSKQKDEEMLARLRALEEERLERRAAAAQLKEQRGSILAAHPGMAADDVSFFVMVKHWRAEREKQCIHNALVVDESEVLGDILCCIRKRPLLQREIDNKVFDVISCSMHGAPASTAVLHEPKEGVDLRKQLKHHSFAMNGGGTEFYIVCIFMYVYVFIHHIPLLYLI
jgi:hypothetical protein